MNKVLMSSMVGKVVKINRGGPEARTGLLLSSGDDYFVLQTKEEGILYIASQHVKSLTENAKQGIDFESDGSESLVWSSAVDFTSMLGELKHQWVTINRGGPEKIEGVLEDANGDYITLILKEEVIRLASYHVKSVAVSVKKKEEEKEEEKNSEDSGESSDSNQSSSENKSNKNSSNSKNSKNSNSDNKRNLNRYYYEIEALDF
jgi:spore coat protein B